MTDAERVLLAQKTLTDCGAVCGGAAVRWDLPTPGIQSPSDSARRLSPQEESPGQAAGTRRGPPGVFPPGPREVRGVLNADACVSVTAFVDSAFPASQPEGVTTQPRGYKPYTLLWG